MLNNMMGQDFSWFTAVVENRMDPLLSGRVQIRCFGLHTENKTDIPTESLLWAQVMMPANSTSVNGLGQSPTGIVEGAWVVGFFLDPRDKQMPLIMGTIPGVPQAPDKSIGFSDPRKDTSAFPKRVQQTQIKADGTGSVTTSKARGEVYPYIIDEPDVNRIARNEKITETVIQHRKDTVDKAVPTASYAKGGTTDVPVAAGAFTEPTTAYAAKYPFNQTAESESGHLLEIDDTPGAERIHERHRTGSFYEIGPDGTKIDKSVQDRYEHTSRNKFEHVDGLYHQTVDGEIRIFANKDGKAASMTIQVGAGGDFNVFVTAGNCNLNVVGDLNTTVSGNHFERIGGNVVREVGGNILETIGGSVTRTTGGTKTEQNGGVYIHVAPQIYLN